MVALLQGCLRTGETVKDPGFQQSSSGGTWRSWGSGYADERVVVSHEAPKDPHVPWIFKHHRGAAAPENPELELLYPELAGMKEKYQADVEGNNKKESKTCLV